MIEIEDFINGINVRDLVEVGKILLVNIRFR